MFNTTDKADAISKAIPEETLNNICKNGQGEKMCRFAAYSYVKSCFFCRKNSDLADKINYEVRIRTRHAKGDNCSGPPDFEPIALN